MNFDTTLLGGCGDDVRIHQSVSIRRPELVRIGRHVSIDEFVVVTTGLELGDHIHIAPHVAIVGGAKGLLKMGHFTNIATGGKIICGSDNFLGDGFITAAGIPEEFRDTQTIAPVVFEDFVNLGANVIIFPGVTLAEGCVIGAGSIVKQSTEPWTIYAGTPAKAIKKRSSENMLRFAKQMGYR